MSDLLTRRRLLVGFWVIVIAFAGLRWAPTWLQPVDVRAQQSGTNSAFALTGIVRGQLLRINIGTLPASRGMDLSWTYRVTDTAGQILVESASISVPSGQWRSSHVSRDALNIVGDPATGRAQVLVQVDIQPARRVHSGNVVGSLEVVDEATGATVNGYFIAESFGFGVEREMKE
jgi:hypothetical protein